MGGREEQVARTARGGKEEKPEERGYGDRRFLYMFPTLFLIYYSTSDIALIKLQESKEGSL